MNALKIEEFENIIKLINLEKFNTKTILITGASGLIGSYLVEFLSYIKKHRCINIKLKAITRSKKRLQDLFQRIDDIEIIEHDLNEPINKSIDCDYIIHLASNAHPLAYSNDPVGTMKTNLIGTISLLDLAVRKNAMFLYISSGEIYGNNKDEDGFTENDVGEINTLNIRSCYPEAKRAAETLCIAYSHQYGININIVRLCYVYGGNITATNSRADAQFLRNVLNKENIVMKSNGIQKRTYCYVADCVSGILKILTDGKNNETYNLANPNSIVSVKEYAETLADISGVELIFAKPDEIEKIGFSKPANSILDASKLLNLGWKPVYDIRKGLRNTFEIAKSRGCNK